MANSDMLPRMDVALALTYDAYDTLVQLFPNIFKQATEIKTKEHAVVLCWRNQLTIADDDIKNAIFSLSAEWGEFQSALFRMPAIKYCLIKMGVGGYNLYTMNGRLSCHGIVIKLNID